MENREPSTPLLRWEDVVAWHGATMTKWFMKQLVTQNPRIVYQARKGKGKARGQRGSRVYYRKSELKRTLGME